MVAGELPHTMKKQCVLVSQLPLEAVHSTHLQGSSSCYHHVAGIHPGVALK
jgi:hypothetical protein